MPTSFEKPHIPRYESIAERTRTRLAWVAAGSTFGSFAILVLHYVVGAL